MLLQCYAFRAVFIPGGGVTPCTRMIGMIVVFLGVVIGDLAFFNRDCLGENY